MEVILLKDVENLGIENDLVNVKSGYGRNYLIPQGMAMVATAGNKKMHAERVRQADLKEQKLLAEIESVIAQLQSATVKVGAKVGQSGKIFGSITSVQLADAIKKQIGVEINRKKIELEEDIKMVGTYTAKVKLKDDPIDLTFEVIED